MTFSERFKQYKSKIETLVKKVLAHKAQIFKYLVSGITAAIVDLGVLHFLDQTHLFHYLVSVNIAFITAFFVSFGLQKYWTFKNAEKGSVNKQMLVYFLVSIVNVAINSLIVHLLMQTISYDGVSAGVLMSKFVEFLSLGFVKLRPVVMSQIIASGLIAFISFFIYRMIFNSSSYGIKDALFKIKQKILSRISIKLSLFLYVCSFILITCFAFEHLKESPQTWMDEGLIIQTAINFTNDGISGIRVSPTEIASAASVSTSYPVTMPIALIFKIFGISILNARLVMVFYLFAFISVLAFWLYRILKVENLNTKLFLHSSSMILLASFPPLYGQGKNVLGEVPGLFFLISSLVFLEIALTNFLKNNSKSYLFLFGGLFIGLTISTKPIFILVVPSIVLGYILYFLTQKQKGIAFPWSKITYILIGILVPILYWFKFQFHGESIQSILNFYANPHSIDVYGAVLKNLKRFVTEGQPIYTLFLFGVWSASVVVRIYKKREIYFSELVAWSMSLLVLCAFIRTIGYYRYFFISEVLSLTFLVYSLFVIKNCLFNNLSKIRLFYLSVSFALVLCIIFSQFNGLFFTSWIAKNRYSNKTQVLESWFENYNNKNGEEVFIYQSPELVPFIKNSNYSQFIDYVAPPMTIGSSSLERIRLGIPEIIVFNEQNMYLDNLKKLASGLYQFDNLNAGLCNPEKVDRYIVVREVNCKR